MPTKPVKSKPAQSLSPRTVEKNCASEACEEPKPQKNKVNHASLRRAYIPEKVTGQEPKPKKSRDNYASEAYEEPKALRKTVPAKLVKAYRSRAEP